MKREVLQLLEEFIVGAKDEVLSIVFSAGGSEKVLLDQANILMKFRFL